MSGFRRPLRVKRRAAGSYVDGRWTPSTTPPTTFTILSSLQPANAQDLMTLPEGRRLGSVYALFTDTLLIPLDNAARLNPDTVQIGADVYEVTSAQAWQNDVVNHFRYLLTKALAVGAENLAA